VVIAIMAIIATLVTAGARRAAESQRISRVKAELANLESAIHSYQGDLGFFPPGGQNGAHRPPLYYELTGTRFDGNRFYSLVGDVAIPDAGMSSVFGVSGFANSNPDGAKNYLPNIKTNQYATISGVRILTVPLPGPNQTSLTDDSGKLVNTWRYVSERPTNNAATFDLWAEVIIGSKTNIVGNWKE